MIKEFTHGSGNVYADLGLANAEEHALKAELIRQIADVIETEHLTQVEVAARLGIGQPDVSKMLTGHFRQFAVGRLLRFLVLLGRDVDIAVRAPAKRKKGAQLTIGGHALETM